MIKRRRADELDATTRQRIFEKVAKRVAELRKPDSIELEFCPELNPDVIVILVDGTMLFESQNRHAAEWLHFRYGMTFEGGYRREALRVHPSLSQKIVAELKAAGFEVNC